MSINTRDLQMARKIATSVDAKGGTVYYVGGFVRDKLSGKPNKDIDIEVHGVTPEQLRGILDQFGEIHTQGASFGVYNLRGYDIDIAQPRTEKATGRGHKDFEVYVDPFIGPEKAAMRRDFTMNAMMENVLTGEIVDPFGGQFDMKNHIIRHVNDKTFVEDPLRIFRAAQFAARFDYKLAPETAELMKTMDVSALPRERVYAEMEKAMLKSDKPSVFFDVLKDTNQLHTWFCEVEKLIGCKQDPTYHPEGDAYTHTMMVLDNAVRYRDQVDKPAYFMTAVLCHDFGKPYTMSVGDDGRIHSYNHAESSVPAAGTFLNRINNDTALRDYVYDMVKNHMRTHETFNHNSAIKTTNHMFDSIQNKKDIVYLTVADCMGKGDTFLERASKEHEFLSERLAVYEKRAAEPMVGGKDLIAMGMRPSAEFSEILKNARKMHFSGVDKAAVLKDIAAKHRDNVDSERVSELIEQVSADSVHDVQYEG